MNPRAPYNQSAGERLLFGLALGTRRVLEAVDRPPAALFGRAQGGHPRGIALVVTLITVTILSAAVVEYAYSTRINMHLSVNHADRLRSQYLARSAVNLSRLLLSFQYALQDESTEAGRGQDGDDMAQLISRAMRRSNFQLYSYIDLLMQPFSTGKLQSPVGGVNLTDWGVEGFGQLAGDFHVEITPEEGKINLNQFAVEEIQEKDLQQLCAMVMDEIYDPIFEQQDEAGDTLDRALVLGRIVDYIDTNTTALELSDECTIRGEGGDELSPYEREESDIKPRNAKLTHVAELYQVPGVTEAFMRTFGDQFTVYPVGRPNLNVATTPIFYSVLCQNVVLEQGVGNAGGESAFNLCARSPQVQAEVLLMSLALDGVREFFSSPMSVLMAYVGSTESSLLPTAEKGQPVGFLSVSQLPAYIEDFKRDPELMAQFIHYSPDYQRMAAENPHMQLDPLNPQLPQWTVNYDRTGLMRSVTAHNPTIYRIKGVGTYGTSQSEVEAVVDFSKSLRRLPDEKALTEDVDDPEQVTELKEALREMRNTMPKGRVLYWRQK